MYLNQFLNDAAPAQPGDVWLDTASVARRPTETREWWEACRDDLPEAGQPQLFAVQEGVRCAALAPLIRRTGLLPRLESIGVRELYEPMDFIHDSPEALETLCGQLVRQPLPLDLQRVPRDSLLVKTLPQTFRGLGYVHICDDTPYPFLEIDASWTRIEAHFNAGRRSDFRRALRHAEKSGPMRFDVIRPEPAKFPALLAEAYETEMHSWKASSGTALAIDPLRGSFYRRYFAACCARGTLRLARMYIGETLVAMQLAIETDKRLWLMKIGYNEAYAQSSPGTLLMLHVIQHAAENGLRSIEFLGAVEKWTQFWTREVRPCVRIRAYPASLPGATALLSDMAIWAARRLRRHFKNAER
jgi:hypothetical protein